MREDARHDAERQGGNGCRGGYPKNPSTVARRRDRGVTMDWSGCGHTVVR
jgi:hypothetical protein